MPVRLRAGARRAGCGRERLPRGDVRRGLPGGLRGRRRDAAAVPAVQLPGGIPSRVAPETTGSIHEGGELGHALVHAYGAVFDNPDLLAVCVVGDGEAETGPLAASWHSTLVSTGGVGERAPALRAAAVAGLGFLGLAVDSAVDATAPPDGDTDVSAPGAAARTLVVHAREDREIARQVRAVLAEA